MRLGPILFLMLSFPILEALGIFWLFNAIGAWTLVWLVSAAVVGIALLRFERVAWGPRLISTLQSGAHPLTALFASGRILLAGGLLVFPGVLSDFIALVLLLLPGTWTNRRAHPLRAANDDVLEGEFRREGGDDHTRLP